MAVLVGAAVAVVGSLISGFFSSRSAKKKIKAEQLAQQRDHQFQAYRDDKARQRQLEDRLYQEKGIANYRGQYKGNATLPTPVFTDPNSVKPVNPYAANTPAPARRPLMAG